MSDTPTLANEAAFLTVLGINPGAVKQGTVNIRFENGQPIVEFSAIMGVPWEGLANAIAAGRDGEIPAEDTTDPLRIVDYEGDPDGPGQGT